MTSTTVIDSDTIIDDFNCHFRVFSGPGAGKTHWLINHIRNVAKKSTNLASVRKIICITYTNVAANEIIERLDEYLDKVDVSTIHSFLYRYIVKPYLHVIVDERGMPLVDFARVDGHDEHYQSYAIVSDWIKGLQATWIFSHQQKSQLNNLRKYLNRVAWELKDGSLHATLKPKEYMNYITKPFKENLETYKSLYWKHGIIDHEDVLYFAYRIFEEHPTLRTFLALKFPYIYVDEFQDTNPIQTQIIKWLGEAGSYIGVIGDLEQSIYSFQGASPEDFRDFTLPDIRNYGILGNKRSTVKIVKLLNKVRSDGLVQTSTNGEEGVPAEIHIGNLKTILDTINSDYKELAILARTNKEVDSIRRKHFLAGSANDVWEDFEMADLDRARFIESIIVSVELFRRRQFTESLKKLSKVIRIRRDGTFPKPFKPTNISKISKIKFRGVAVSLINKIMDKYDNLLGNTLLNFYDYISNIMKESIEGLELTRISRGAPHTFAQSTMLSDLFNSVKLSGNENRNVRTIHQAKGTEFDNVLVSLNHLDNNETERQLDILFGDVPCGNAEDKRILYVAMSRAKKHLFIATPKMVIDKKQFAISAGCTIVE